MADATVEDLPEEPAKKSKLPLILGVVLALAGGGGAFYATYANLLLPQEVPEIEGSSPKEANTEVEAGPAVAFVPIDP